MLDGGGLRTDAAMSLFVVRAPRGSNGGGLLSPHSVDAPHVVEYMCTIQFIVKSV